jgi:hypothetical protein
MQSDPRLRSFGRGQVRITWKFPLGLNDRKVRWRSIRARRRSVQPSERHGAGDRF